jgi:hypothetical protein
MEVRIMKTMLNCNQAGRRFSGVEVEASPQPLSVQLRTPKGVYDVEIPAETVLAGIFPALRTFVISKAEELGVTITNDGTGRKSGRVILRESS